jgi:hypothetical protein
MIIVVAFLGKVYPGPHDEKEKSSGTVVETYHYPDSCQTHDDEIENHPLTMKHLQPFKTNKGKSKSGINKNFFNPASQHRAYGFRSTKKSVKHPKKD